MASAVLAALGCDAYQLLSYGAYAILALFVWQAVNPITRWRYRHIPGPFAWPFIGNIPSIMKHQFHVYQHLMHKQYGPIFKIWFGSTPWVIVCDAENIRKANYKLNSHLGLPNTMLGEERFLVDNVLVFARGETWRLLKKAWDPAILHRASLEGYAPLMQECAQGLLERLEPVVRDGEVVDVWVELQRMTLDVVGSCAFGIKFYNTGGTSGAVTDWDGDSEALRDCCSKFFRTSMGDEGSLWLIPVLMLPQFADAFRWLAYRLPDKGHRSTVQCMQGMASAARKIIARTSAERQQSGAAGGAQDAATAADQDGTTAAAAGAAAKKLGAADGKVQGVMPGSFVAQLEAWRAKHDPSAEKLSDNLIAAQVITFLLAGYETTANALGFLVYRLSIHPEAQQKLQQELDTVLGGRQPTLEDLPKFLYLDACMKEALRLHPPTPMTSRVFHEDPSHPASLELCGKSIPKGAVIMTCTSAASVSPNYWVQPEEFLPERFLPETKGKLGPFDEHAYLPFGSGGRKCTGYKFAEQEMLLVGAALLQKFSFTRPAGLGPLKETLGVALAPRDGVKVLMRTRK